MRETHAERHVFARTEAACFCCAFFLVFSDPVCACVCVRAARSPLFLSRALSLSLPLSLSLSCALSLAPFLSQPRCVSRCAWPSCVFSLWDRCAFRAACDRVFLFLYRHLCVSCPPSSLQCLFACSALCLPSLSSPGCQCCRLFFFCLCMLRCCLLASFFLCVPFSRVFFTVLCAVAAPLGRRSLFGFRACRFPCLLGIGFHFGSCSVFFRLCFFLFYLVCFWVVLFFFSARKAVSPAPPSSATSLRSQNCCRFVRRLSLCFVFEGSLRFKFWFV